MNEQIPGVPVGMKLVRIGPPKGGDWFIGRKGVIHKSLGDACGTGYLPILAADNNYNVPLHLVDLKGRKPLNGTVEASYFVPQKGQEFIASDGNASTATADLPNNWLYRRILLAPEAPKTKRVLVGEWEIVSDIKYAEAAKGFILPEAAERLAQDSIVYRIEEREV